MLWHSQLQTLHLLSASAPVYNAAKVVYFQVRFSQRLGRLMFYTSVMSAVH